MTEKCKELRKTVLKTCCRGKDGNIQSVFSSLEIIWTLYDRILRVSPENYCAPERDIFVCSKGQATLGLLAVLSEKGFLEKKELDSFCGFSSRISMQADRTKLPGIEVSAGSLGHGFPIAVGMAWAAKIKHLHSRVYVLAGDGEMNEGTMWESAMFAASEKLENLTLIVDDNNSLGKMINVGSLKEKLTAFGFDTAVVDGHNEEALFRALTIPNNSPRAIIAKTQRGFGSKTIMEDNSWFHRAPNDNELEQLLAEVDLF